MDKKQYRKGMLAIIAAACLWGMIGLYIRQLNRCGYYEIQIVAIRALGASFCLFCFLLVRDRDKLKIRLKDIWVFLGTGIGSMVFFNLCYFGSMRHTSLAVAAALLYTAPAFVAILARIFLGEKIAKRGILAIALAILGSMLTAGMITGGLSADISGLLLGLGAGFGYALYSIFGKFAIEKGYTSMTITFYTFLVAALATVFVLLRRNAERAPLTASFAVATLGLIVFSTVLAYLLYTKGLESVPAGHASVFASIEPVVATLISVFVFREQISLEVLFGIILILASTIVMSVQSEKS